MVKYSNLLIKSFYKCYGINKALLCLFAPLHEWYMVYNINLISYVLLSCVIVFAFLNIKVVEGSGSKGTSKYVGEGVTYGVFLET